MSHHLINPNEKLLAQVRKLNDVDSESFDFETLPRQTDLFMQLLRQLDYEGFSTLLVDGKLFVVTRKSRPSKPGNPITRIKRKIWK